MTVTLVVSLFVVVPSTFAGIEAVGVLAVNTLGTEAAILRANGDVYRIEVGVGCIALYRYPGQVAYVSSPGLFAGIGSTLILPEYFTQECRIWNSEYLGTYSGPPPPPPPPPPTDPSISVSISPNPLDVGTNVTIRAAVTPGSNPTSTGVAVAANVTAIGGSSLQMLFDDGTHGDERSGDSVFSVQVPVPQVTPVGTVTVAVAVADAQNRSGGTTVALQVRQPPDTDGDGMPDAWEIQFGLNPNSAVGSDGPSGDPDGDGVTNAAERQNGTHPKGTFRRFFAEGATSDFFNARFALLNAGQQTAHVLMRFLRGDGTVVSHVRSVAPGVRATVDPKAIPGLESAEFSALVEADSQVVVDRTMSWDRTGYGGHAETGVAAPSSTWYLAEGATHSGFNLFYLIQNPTPTAATVAVTYLLPPPRQPKVLTYRVPANSRFNIWVDTQDGLENTDVSAKITSDVPVIVERAMYLDQAGQVFSAGHESAGVTAPATRWFLAEGATGDFFDLFVLIANPGDWDATIRATFLLPGGTTITRDYAVQAKSRFNIWVDTVDPALVDTAVSTVIESTNGEPVIVERSMWWPGPTAASWNEAHNSAGVTESGVKWAVAEGEVGGLNHSSTFVLIANPSVNTALVRVTLRFEDGTSSARDFVVTGNSRFNVDAGAHFVASQGLRFGAIVESLNGTPIVVERAMYWNAGGQFWAAGTNAVATRLQ